MSEAIFTKGHIFPKQYFANKMQRMFLNTTITYI